MRTEFLQSATSDGRLFHTDYNAFGNTQIVCSCLGIFWIIFIRRIWIFRIWSMTLLSSLASVSSSRIAHRLLEPYTINLRGIPIEVTPTLKSI